MSDNNRASAQSTQRGASQRQETEKTLANASRRLDGIIASAMDAIISINAEQRIVLFNPAAERMFGLSAAEALGQSLERLIPQRFRAAHSHHVETFGQTGVSNRHMGALGTLSGVRVNGEEFPIEASISQVEIGGEKLFTVIVRDDTIRHRTEAALQQSIQELRQAQEELRQSHAELESRVQQRTADLAAANRELEAFGYSVSHDLRAPLRHVGSYIKLLEKNAGLSLDDKSRRHIRVIAAAAERMGNLIDDLLVLSRIGRATMVESEINLRQLVDEARGELAPEIKGRTIEWHLGPLPRVRGDVSLLRSAVVNLLSNAVKYTRSKNPARIDVGSTVAEHELTFFVRDNGAGFDMQFVEKLFGVFQRLHRAEDFEGTGIGLATVRRIIQRHGGRTWAEGAPEHGATFYFSLPISRLIQD